MRFEVVKKGIYLVPFGDSDRDRFVKISQGEVLTAEYKKNRNYEFHKKFFALLNIGFENQDNDKTFELYRAKILIQIGHCDIIFLENGTTNFIPKSISYESVPDNHEFEILYNKAVEYVASKLSLTNEELAIEIASHF